MKASKQMAKALLTSGQYRTKKYLYTLGYNMYGQRDRTTHPDRQRGPQNRQRILSRIFQRL